MRDVTGEIARELADNRVVLYRCCPAEIGVCPYAASMFEVLQRYPVTFKAVSVATDPDKRAAVIKHSGHPTMPQLFVAGKLVGGSSEVKTLHGTGALATLLGL